LFTVDNGGIHQPLATMEAEHVPSGSQYITACQLPTVILL